MWHFLCPTAVGLLAEQANLIEADVTAATADISTRVGVRSRNSSLIQVRTLPWLLAGHVSCMKGLEC